MNPYQLISYKYVFAFTLFLTISCNSSTQDQTKTLSKDQIFWDSFSKALQKQDVAFLIQHSLDTIQCGDCGLKSETNSEYFKSDFLFENHLDKFKPTENMKEYTIYNDEKGNYNVNFKIKSSQAPEGGYNVIYQFIETSKGYRFQGMFPT